MAELAASDIYPVLRRFFVETGLQRTLKAFDKETAPEDEEAAPSKQKKKLAKKLATCEILQAVQSWLETGVAPAAEAAAAAAVEAPAPTPAPPTPRKRAKSDASEASKVGKKKRKKSEVVEEAAEVVEEPPKKKKRKASADLSEAKVEEAAAAAPASKKDKQKKTPGTPFSRIDHDKWVAVAAKQDNRLLDNTHDGKEKYGIAGDSWGDQASSDLLKVKGKGFRKEMQKKKRASWRGGGEISQVTNSIAFADSDSE